MKLPIIVLCHTIYNDVWRTDYQHEHKESSKFLVRYLIEKKTDIGEDGCIAITSEQVTNSISESLPPQVIGKGYYPAQFVMALNNLVLSLDTRVKNINESVLIIADLLYSKGFDVILVSNMPKKVRLAIEFYQRNERSSKKWKEKDVLGLFKIINTTQLQEFLVKNDKETCDRVYLQLEK